MINSVFTLYELSNGDDTEGEGMLPYLNSKLNFIRRAPFGKQMQSRVLYIINRQITL